MSCLTFTLPGDEVDAGFLLDGGPEGTTSQSLTVYRDGQLYATVTVVWAAGIAPELATETNPPHRGQRD